MNDHFMPGGEAGAAAAAQPALLDDVDDLGRRHPERLLERLVAAAAAPAVEGARVGVAEVLESTGVSRGCDLWGYPMAVLT
jgi:hypothetical protein